jgi:hypothetical protein
MPLGSRDYILRVIERMAEFLAAVAGKRREGKLDEAARDIDQAKHDLLGPLARSVDSLDASTVAMLLEDAAKTRAYAQLLDAEADVASDRGDERRAEALRARAAAITAAIR